MDNKKRYIIIFFAIVMIAGMSLFAVYSRWLLAMDDVPVVAGYMHQPSMPMYQPMSGAFRSTSRVRYVSSEAGYYGRSNIMGGPATMSSTSAMSGLRLESAARTASYGGGNAYGTNPAETAPARQTVSQPVFEESAAGFRGMLASSGHFTTAASHLSGGETTLSSSADPVVIRRASDPGDVGEENELPVGDMPVWLLLLCSCFYAGFVRKKENSKSDLTIG